MRVVLRLPFTVIFLIVMVAANLLAGTVTGTLPSDALGSWGISTQSVQEGEYSRLFTATFLSHDLGMLIRQFVFAAAIIGAYEWLEGTVRTLAMFLLIDILGTLLVLFVVLPWLVAAPVSVGVDALVAYDVGMSAGGFGLIGALIARQARGWILLCGICLAIGIKILFAFDPIADSAHLLCLFIGFGFQAVLNARGLNRGVALR